MNASIQVVRIRGMGIAPRDSGVTYAVLDIASISSHVDIATLSPAKIVEGIVFKSCNTRDEFQHQWAEGKCVAYILSWPS